MRQCAQLFNPLAYPFCQQLFRQIAKDMVRYNDVSPDVYPTVSGV